MTWSRLARATVLFIVAAFVAVLPASAAAATPELLWQVPDNGEAGSGAGQLDNPEGIAADPSSGHVYVADYHNVRIDEFDAWGQFVKAWGWGVRDGAAELQTCGPKATPPSVTCLKGIAGSGPGQFANSKGGIAVDVTGNIYAGDMDNHRLQKFDSEGNFLLMIGGEVNKTTNGNLCTVASGDVCGVGASGEGDGQFKNPGTNGSGTYIATGPAGTIFVGDSKGRIQEFEANGAFKAKVTLEDELEGKTVQSLAIDGAGNFYVKPVGDNDHVYKFSPAGALILTITVELQPESPLAIDATDNLYVVAEKHSGPAHREVIEFGPDGSPKVPVGSGFAVEEGIVGGKEKGVLLSDLATNTVTAAGGVDIYVTATSGQGTSFASSYGPGPDKWPAPAKPPEVTAQYSVSVGGSEALLRAQINPLFWADTSYYVEYGTGKCSEGGCASVEPAPPGVQLGAGVIGSSVTTKGVSLSGLSPGTTYHYRFVAQSSGGGPVHGIGPGEAEASFTTPAPLGPPNPSCPNASLRGGASAFLPDCRAYEMVSPVDKNGGDIVGLCSPDCHRAETNQASVDGERLTYSSYKAFGDALSGPYVNQYIATRGPEGWSTHGISPPFASGLFGGVINSLFITETEFKAFSPDLKSAWLVDASRLPLTPDAVEGFVNLYRQDTGDGALTALTTAEPKFAKGKGYGLEFQGRSADGADILFTARAALTPDAAVGSEDQFGPKPQLYGSFGGELRLVSVLPDGSASPDDSSAGTPAQAGGGPSHGSQTLEHAISDDGSRIFWSSTPNGPTQAKLYLRLNPDQPQSEIEIKTGKCKQPAKACTVAVSSGPSQFWTADSDGSRALFSENEDLYEYRLSAKSKTLIAHKALGVLGASEDLSHVYFASKESLAPGATAGERNLYLDKDGAMTFVATLASVGVIAPSALDPRPVMHVARVTPDGRRIAFMSTNSLTGYDNTDLGNGKAASEVFTYDAETGQLSCASCNPSGARPDGEEMVAPYVLKGAGGSETDLWAAAWLNTAENSFYAPNALSKDGSRLFFNSFDALVPRDTNGAQDVYQWEAPGSGDCSAGSASFSALNDGCISLISTGESAEVSEFVDATPNGSDVFFKTTSGIDPRDPGLIDIYDARVGGGYPPPPTPPAPCLGDACQSVPAPPNDPTPASAAFRGVGDPAPRKPRRSCRTRKGKAAKASRQAKQKQAKRCQRAKRRVGR
jgi:DNA-binding beta-propeller fold protein YncE